MSLVVNWIGQSAMLTMRRDIFTHIQSLHTQYFDKNPVGRLLTRVMNDVAYKTFTGDPPDFIPVFGGATYSFEISRGDGRESTNRTYELKVAFE